MFVASLLVIGIFGIWVVRYFVRQHERLLDDHKQSRECYQENLRGVVAEQSARMEKLPVFSPQWNLVRICQPFGQS